MPSGERDRRARRERTEGERKEEREREEERDDRNPFLRKREERDHFMIFFSTSNESIIIN